LIVEWGIKLAEFTKFIDIEEVHSSLCNSSDVTLASYRSFKSSKLTVFGNLALKKNSWRVQVCNIPYFYHFLKQIQGNQIIAILSNKNRGSIL
jgi:hypothetical protein